MSISKHIRAVELLAAEFDCKVERARRGHLKIRSQSGGLVAVAPLSPSDHRGMANLRSSIRRAVTEGGR